MIQVLNKPSCLVRFSLNAISFLWIILPFFGNQQMRPAMLSRPQSASSCTSARWISGPLAILERPLRFGSKSWYLLYFHTVPYLYVTWIPQAAHPGDLLAVKCAHDTYFYLGQSRNIFESIHRGICHSAWSDNIIWIFTMQCIHGGKRTRPRRSCAPTSKGVTRSGWKRLVNTKKLRRQHSLRVCSLVTCLLAVATGSHLVLVNLFPRDAWAVHGCAHVKEMTGSQRPGIRFLKDTHKDWKACQPHFLFHLHITLAAFALSF